ncbi:MAG TPA: cysteine desulfurase family protein [bacterium]|nr:cysteine desulfurase family protein [bacterium]
MDRIYFDHNATTRPDSTVRDAVVDALENLWGNPSSLHWFGQRVNALIEDAREAVARLINADPAEIIFTSGGTEANNLAIMGAAFRDPGKRGRVITSTIEHPSVRSTVRNLATHGINIVEVPVSGGGRVDPEAVAAAITDDTVLITIMAANNETGMIQPIEEIGRTAKEHGVLFHTDAVQAAGKIKIDAQKWPVDMITIAAHKFYGPKGVGALWLRRGLKIKPRQLGGGQEAGLRAGTENIPGIAGLGAAARLASANLEKWSKHISGLRDLLEKQILARMPDAIVNGDPAHRVPNTTSISFMGAEGEAVAINLDLKGIAVSTGSACSTGANEPSHVLLAQGMTPRQAECAIRFSLGKDNTEAEVRRAIEAVTEAVAKVRSISGGMAAAGGKR